MQDFFEKLLNKFKKEVQKKILETSSKEFPKEIDFGFLIGILEGTPETIVEEINRTTT